MARVHLRRNREVAQFCETSANIFDVLMHSEDFLDNQNGAEVGFASRGCTVGGDGAIGDGDFDFAGGQAIGIGRDDGLCHDRARSEREAAHERGRQKTAAIECQRWQQAIEFWARFIHGKSPKKGQSKMVQCSCNIGKTTITTHTKP